MLTVGGVLVLVHHVLNFVDDSGHVEGCSICCRLGDFVEVGWYGGC
jgi:hypothetical protein